MESDTNEVQKALEEYQKIVELTQKYWPEHAKAWSVLMRGMPYEKQNKVRQWLEELPTMLPSRVLAISALCEAAQLLCNPGRQDPQ